MKSILKFTLETTDLQDILMPKGAKILCIQTQNNWPCLWAICEGYVPMETRRFRILPTGHKIDDVRVDQELVYIGTYQLMSGNLIFHCFEVIIQP